MLRHIRFKFEPKTANELHRVSEVRVKDQIKCQKHGITECIFLHSDASCCGTFDSMVGWLFIVLRPSQEYFIYMETSPLPVKGCKI
jgi:hypothetical protein